MTLRGKLFGVGVGPGDPELMTLKAARVLATAPVTAFFSKRGKTGHARSIANDFLNPKTNEIRLHYPFTTEMDLKDPRYQTEMIRFYDVCAEQLESQLLDGKDVAVLCEGDPFFYGSFMYIFDRLRSSFVVEVIPGVTGMSACWTRAMQPITHGDDVLVVLPATLPEEALVERLIGADAAVFMKVGRNLAKIRSALIRSGLLDRAFCIEQGSMPNERISRMIDKTDDDAGYFTIVLVPGRQRQR
ncbi:precorrin-2/cobalt-factor-2 C20-methyltransferase [Rhodoligotrophos appendicifer]|uniref:precorrin-2 C(20)-methyltransferase n=1 Tax=Rhodoligotrophos appendicifer TaxID=987056 RepID=UPI001184D66A|nr:precorrin-2 C(20)-methyltransferase [Rhodoligotrophos appendicifer]